MQKHKYTNEEIKYLKSIIPGRSYEEVRNLFNKEFKLNLSIKQIGSTIKRYGLRNGLDTRFQKGNVPLNPIKKGQRIGIETQFKKGQRPSNYKPVGYERVDRDGYILIKVSEKGAWHERWRHKHKVLWEKKNGPIPKGHYLVFADGDRQNIEFDNLILVTQAQMLIMNKRKLIYNNDPESTKTGTLIAKVIDKANKRRG